MHATDIVGYTYQAETDCPDLRGAWDMAMDRARRARQRGLQGDMAWASIEMQSAALARLEMMNARSA